MKRNSAAASPFVVAVMRVAVVTQPFEAAAGPKGAAVAGK